MKRALVALALLAGALVPRLAQAKAVEDVRLDTDGSDVVVTVVADEALATPNVRTSPGSVRVRFYDANQTKSLRVNGDGGAVRHVDLGRGSDQTAALVISFGDRTKLAPADVRVERDGDTTTLRIARGLLPAVRGALPPPAAAKPAAAAPAAAVPAAPAKPAVSAPTVAPAAPAAPASTVTVRTEDVAPAPQAESARNALGALTKKPAEKSAPAEKLKLNDGGSSPMPMLLAVSALLALSYFGLQLMLRNKKKLAGTDIPAIDVIAQRRIGPRHQLVIVRAFDRDYLLSIQGGQTTVVARSSRKKLEEAEALLAPLPKMRADGGEGRAFEDDDEPTFGGELFKQALEQRERAREHTASVRSERREPTSSTRPEQRERREPAAGSRLEQREPTSSARLERRESTAGMRLEAVRAEARAELLREAEATREAELLRKGEIARELELARREEAELDSLPVPASAVSDSVSGLLRLRKQSKR